MEILVRMLSVLLALSFLVSYSATSCPPVTGIYLMYKGDCYPDGSYIRDSRMTIPPETNLGFSADYIQCILPGSTINGGGWVDNFGRPINCSSNSDNDPLRCITSNTSANVTLYRPNGQYFSPQRTGVYRCCLPTSCCDPNTNSITVHIFRHANIVEFKVALPHDITVYPQHFTLHCITTGEYFDVTYNSYSAYSFERYSKLTKKSCRYYGCDSHVNRTLLHSSNATYDHALTFDVLPNKRGNYRFECNLKWFGSVRNAFITIKVPSYAPYNVTVAEKNLTSVTLKWDLFGLANGYIVNITNNGLGIVQIIQLEGSNNKSVTIASLEKGVTYEVRIRAYLQLPGPTTTITVQTSVISSLKKTKINVTNYRIDCITTTDVNPSTDVYWLVNGVMKNNSMYTNDTNTTLFVSFDPLGVFVNVTCIAMNGGVNYSQSVVLYGEPKVIEITVDFPSSYTIPQYYIVRSIVASQFNLSSLLDWYYFSNDTLTHLSSNYCVRYFTGIRPQQFHPGYLCFTWHGRLYPINGTVEYYFIMVWNAMNITEDPFSQLSNNGDHVLKCILGESNTNVTITVPASAPSSLTVVRKTATTITVSWTALDLSDADGYVVNVTSDTDTVQTVQVKGSRNNTITVNGLRGETTYNITVRAYQQLLGPASSTISVQTLPGPNDHFSHTSITSHFPTVLPEDYTINQSSHDVASDIFPTMSGSVYIIQVSNSQPSNYAEQYWVVPLIVLLLCALLVAVVTILSILVYLKRTKLHQYWNTSKSVKCNRMEGTEVLNISQCTFVNNESIPRHLINRTIAKSHLNLIETIGQGEFGIVYRALLTSGNSYKPVAVKTLKDVFSSGYVETIKQECSKMSFFDHQNVLPLLGVCVDAGPAPYIIMPFMSNGSLLSYLKRKREIYTVAPDIADDQVIQASRKQLLSMCLQVANGMTYLAQQKFVHRDLAARNCMIDSNGVIKISDFGLTEEVYSQNYFRQFKKGDFEMRASVKLPVKWMALESLHYGIFSEKTDVWSYGVLLWEVFSVGMTPYPGLDPPGVIELLDSGGRLLSPVNAACSKEIYKKLMFPCWETSPSDRPTFSELFKSIQEAINPLANYFELLPL